MNIQAPIRVAPPEAGHHLQLMTRYSRRGASSRLRFLQYRAVLARAGMTTEHAPLYDDAYLEGVYAGARSGMAVIEAVRRRLAQLYLRPAPDLIWLQNEVLPWAPWGLERQLWPHDVPLVVDYDDAIFHRYDRHRRPLVRRLLGHKIDDVMARAELVTAGNAYLAERALAAGARRVAVVPTVVDLDAYPTGPVPQGGRPVVGWIGTPQTWAELARDIYTVLAPTLAARGAVFRAVGASLTAGDCERLELRPWSEATEGAAIQAMDIGVMPLPDTPWARGKCGYKLIQYMACGRPVVASPVGVNAEIVEHGVNGFLVRTDAEWREAVETLLGDPDLRARMGAAGRRKVEARFALQDWGPRVATLLAGVARG